MNTKHTLCNAAIIAAMVYASPSFSDVTPLSNAEIAFNLSEQMYPALFPMDTQSVGGYQYRCYGKTHLCLGVKDGAMAFFDGVNIKTVGSVDSIITQLKTAATPPQLFQPAATSSAATQDSADPVILSFATVGDSREEDGAAYLNAQDKIWLQNTAVLARMTKEIQAEKNKLLFFNGDMIMGYKTEVNSLNRQYAYWRGMMAQLMENGVYVVPVPGNHEIQEKTAAGAKLARESNEQTWRDNMGDLIIDTNRWKNILGADIAAWDVTNAPPLKGADGMATDQRQLSYSFDFQGIHFVVISTDAVANDSKAPVAWLASDLAAAKARGVTRNFVFGHKMAFTYKYTSTVKAGGLDTNPDNQKAFWDLIEGYNATYFCGHEHIFNAMQPRGKAWQVIVGSGGSPFDAKPGDSTNPDDYTYAWANVKVYRSGKVHVDVFGFDSSMGPTRLVKGWDIN
jgi:hypothetical protein